MKKIIIIIVACGFIFGCKDHKKPQKKEAKYHITSPIKIDTIKVKDYVCQIHSIRNIELRALEKGYLQKRYVDEGQKVKKGQKMFQIMPNFYQAELNKAKAEANFVKIEYENTKILADSNVVSINELSMVKARYQKALAEVKIAETHLGFTDIRAPFDGITNLLNVREGSLLDEGDLLTTLSDNHAMWVYFNVPESEYLDYAFNKNKDEHQEVTLRMANNKFFNHKGIIETIEGEFNNETGNIAFRATFPNPEGILRHGETGSIFLEIPLKEALIIPQKSTFEVLNKKYVFVLDKENKVHQREINVAEELSNLFVIKEGLIENDKILLEGIRLVKEGDEIEYDFIEPKELIAKLNLYTE